MKSRFAETLYAKFENKGTENEYLQTGDSPEDVLEVGETAVVAEYKLVRTSRVKAEMKLKRG